MAAVTAYAKELEVMPTIQGSSELEADTCGWGGWLQTCVGIRQGHGSCCRRVAAEVCMTCSALIGTVEISRPAPPCSCPRAVPSGARASLSDDVASSRDQSITSILDNLSPAGSGHAAGGAAASAPQRSR